MGSDTRPANSRRGGPAPRAVPVDSSAYADDETLSLYPEAVDRDPLMFARCVLLGAGVGAFVGFYLVSRTPPTPDTSDTLTGWILYVGGGALSGILVGVVLALILIAAQDRRR